MTTVTLGGGLGGWAAIAPQPTYGASLVTPTRPLTIKNAKATFNPHFVQGTEYLRAGQSVDLGSAHVATYTDASGTISGDIVNTGFALLLATMFGSSAQFQEVGTTTAYQLGGSLGLSYGAPDPLSGISTSGCCFDMQWGVPDSGATSPATPASPGVVHPYTFHSCMITKAEIVFDRAGMSTYSFDFDAQQIEQTTPLIATPAFPSAPIPFTFISASSFTKIGTYGSEVYVSGIRKSTWSLARKLATDRIYQGTTVKAIPVTNGETEITISIDADFSADAKTAIYDQFLANTPFSVVTRTVGSAIGTSGLNDTLQLNATNCFVNTGGEPNLDGPDMVKSTLALNCLINTENTSPLLGSLVSADSGF